MNDPLGRRVAEKINGTTVEKYLWQGGTRLLAIYGANNNLLMRFLYADGRMPVAMTKAGVTYYLTYDQVGSPRYVVNASGTIMKEVEYDSFGNVLSDSNPSFTVPFGFAGGLSDPDTGLVRFGFRDYDPDTGRWTAKDPILFSGGDSNLFGYADSVGKPMGWPNLYIYAENNPIMRIDPYGLYSWGFGGTIGFLTFSWDSAHPFKTKVEWATNLELGGGFFVNIDHPNRHTGNPCDINKIPKAPVTVNLGLGKWLGVSTDGDDFTVKIGLSVALSPISISDGRYRKVP